MLSIEWAGGILDQEIPIPRCPFLLLILLLEGAAGEANEQEPQDQGTHPPLLEELGPHCSLQVAALSGDQTLLLPQAQALPAPQGEPCFNLILGFWGILLSCYYFIRHHVTKCLLLFL